MKDPATDNAPGGPNANDMLRILLVEDNPGDADLIQARLHGGACGPVQFLHVERIAKAREALRTEQVDVVLLDLNLPDSTGVDTVVSIRKAAPSVPVVVLTGNEDREMGIAAVQAGAQDFLGKDQATGPVVWRVAHYAIERQRTQERLRESERFLQSSLDGISSCIAILDETGTALFANRAWNRFMGKAEDDPQACLGINYLERCQEANGMGARQAEALADGLRSVLEGRRNRFDIECQYSPAGAGGWILLRATRFTSLDGARVAISHEDISDLKRSQLREQRLARVLRGVRNVNQLITKASDKHALVQSACETLTRSLSYGEAWIMLAERDDQPPFVAASRIDGLIVELPELLAGPGWPKCVQRMAGHSDVMRLHASAEECSSCPMDGTCGDTRLVARLVCEGHVFGTMGVQIPPGANAEEEEEEGLFGELVDDIAFGLHKMQLAERHQTAQTALTQSEERYRKLFENATVGIFASSLAGRPLVVNPAMARMVGLESSDEAIRRCHDLATQLYLHPERRQELLDALHEHGSVREFEYEARTIDGHCIWLSMSARLAPSPDSDEPRIEGFVTDITSRKEAEARMQESERLYRLLADNTVDCIWLMDLDGYLLYVNPASEALIGYSPDEIAGRSFSEFCEEDSQRIIRSAIDGSLAALPETESTAFETFLQRKDGTPVAVEITGRLVVDPDGRPLHLQGMARDITERHRAMEEIRSRENLLSKIFDTLPVGVWLADSQGNLYRSNEEGRRIWGHPPMLGRDEYGEFRARRLPRRDPVQADDWALAHTLREKATILNELLEIDAFDGEQRTILNSTTPVLNADGDVEAAVVVNLDVTELQQAQAERERLRLAIEQSLEIIVITDADGNIQYANPAFGKVTGHDPAEVLGKNPRLLKSGKQDAGFYRELWDTITNGRTWRGRFVNRRRDGTLYTEEATISPVVDETGRTINYVAVKRDITEQLRMEREREKLEEQVENSHRLESVGRLAGGVAHDLNNLLVPILGYAEILMEDLENDETNRQSVAEIVAAGKRARALVSQLLAFGRRQILEFESVDVNGVLANFENLLRRTIREDIEVRILPAPHLPRVKADVGQLEQIIMNLAVNGQDAMPDGGRLTIETELAEVDERHAALHEEMTAGWYVLLSVSDDGCGMDEETRSRIFEPFFTTKECNQGTGLGLATVYGIVKQHGGTIWVYSEPGQGTTFKVYLPIDEEEAGELKQRQETLRPAGGSETILLVEDDDQVQKLARAILRREGYTVVLAANGTEAIRRMATHESPVDLLLTDVIMPDMNGRVLYDKLSATHPSLKALYMSGYTDSVIAHHGMLDPGLHFIQKPFTIHGLATAVREALDE